MSTKILIVEDDNVTQKMCQVQLTNKDYEVKTASNGHEALNLLTKESFHLILTDIEMPVMGGFEFYKKLKENPKTSSVPVVILSSHSKMEDTFMAIGVDSFITKPIQIEELSKKIGRLLKGMGNIDIETLKKKLINHTRDASSSAKTVLAAGSSNFLFAHLADELRPQGYGVDISSTIEDVFTRAAELNPKIILLEVQVGHVSAYEIVKILKEELSCKIPIVIFSLHRNIEEIEKSTHDYFYRNRLVLDFPDEPVPYYLGGFSLKSYKENFAKAVGRLLSKEIELK